MIAVLIPTRGRPEKLAALVTNIHATTHNLHTVYLIAERTDTDTMKAAMGLDAAVLLGSFGSCATAVNYGYREAAEPFVAVGNDDVRFHDGWDTKALAHMNDTIHIVGLNDGSGDTKCFQLVRRAYIEQESGVFDQPNTLYHTYQSQCCDTEFAFYAQLRGVWADAYDAVLEHEHWSVGKADRDHPNYVKARDTNAADLDEYNRRRPLWDPAGTMPACVPRMVAA